MNGDIKIEGLDEIKTRMRLLTPRLQGNALQSALTKGARIIVNQARAMAPRDKGVLRRAIYQAKSKFSTLIRPSRIIAVRQGKKQQTKNRDAFYWRFIEFGHGVIRAKYAKVLGTPAKGFFGKEVAAQPARPFMRPAFDSKKFEALEAFRVSLKDEVEKRIAKKR